MVSDYETLNLAPSATPEQVRQAYLDLVKVWHPDRFANDDRLRAMAERKMMEITAAYWSLKGELGAALDGDENPASRAASPPAMPMPPAAYSVPETPVAPAPEASPNAARGVAQERDEVWPPDPPPAASSGALKWLLGIAGVATLVLIAGLWMLFRTRPAAAPQNPQPNPSAVQATVQPVAPPSGGGTYTGPNAGEIAIVNQTATTATIRISMPSAPGAVLNTSVIPPDSTAIARSLRPETYVIDISFSDRRFPPLHLGPYEIDQTHSMTGTRADRYQITLKPGR